MKVINFLVKKWWIFALILIFLYSYYIRAINIVPDKLLSFDPIFQYRFTKYLADWGHLPIWDELTYYVGRKITISENPPFMFYLTILLYWLQPFGWSLMTTCAYASALYGALIVFPAFLLGKELSNKYGGLFSATLIGTAPQILVRTFGSSYDNDQLVVFFLLLTFYLGIRFLKKRNISNFCLSLLGFTAFMLTWNMFAYSFLIIMGGFIIYFILTLLVKFLKKNERFDTSLRDIKGCAIGLTCLFFGLCLTTFIVNENFINYILSLVGFAIQPETKIVNISIAELQPFNIFDIQGWILATGRFITGDYIIDSLTLILIVFLIFFGLLSAYRKDFKNTSFLLILLLIGAYTTVRGIRFTEFTSAMFITLAAVGFGHLIEYSKKDNFLKSVSLGIGILLSIVAISTGLQVGKGLGPDINPNWDNAWNFLKTKTPELSLVGTWWDPGHMIAGLAERRNMADGAHCGKLCFMGINDRIADAGKIMATENEEESVKLIKKYQGNSPEVYWIASDDLIGKFQWVQYFGTGCDARVNSKCPLYIQLPLQYNMIDNEGNIVLRNYGNVYLFQDRFPFYVQDINAAIFDEIIYYENGKVKIYKLNETEKQFIISYLKPLERQLNVRFTNQTIPMTVWIPQHYSYIVIIPPNQRNNVFTKMFFLEGQGLKHFKQVFRNEQVKIYKVIF